MIGDDNMIHMAFKNIISRKMRSVLCIIAIMVCVFLNGSTATMNQWMYESMTSELAKYMGKIYVQQGGSSYPPFDSTISDMKTDEIYHNTEEYINIHESTSLMFIRLERGMMPFLPAEAMAIGMPIGKEAVFLGNLEAKDGNNRFSDQSDNEVILGENAADYYKAEVGKNIIINNTPLLVKGILKRSSMDSVNISAIMPLQTIQRVFEKEGTISAVLLTAKDVNKVNEIKKFLEVTYPSLDIITQDDMNKDAQKVLKMPMMYMKCMSITAFIVAVVVLMCTMVMAVTERTREIGILLALGAHKKLILCSIIIEIIILSIIGGIPGALLSIPMAKLMETSLPSFWQLIPIVLFAILAACVSVLFPIYKASKVDPIIALRYE